MKRLILSIVTAFSLLGLAVPVAAADRYWQVQIFEPATELTTRKLNVEYKVLSTVKSDDFTVELFENNASKSTQNVTHDYGDSGVFNIDLPGTGTYSYKVTATNSGDASVKDSSTVTVDIVNEPNTTVTVVRNTGGQGGATTAGTATDGTDGNGGAVASDNTDDGTVGQDGAKTNGDSNGAGDVLASEDQKNNNDSNTGWYIGIPLALLALGAAIYWLRGRTNPTE
jgi:hypothetical protein